MTAAWWDAEAQPVRALFDACHLEGYDPTCIHGYPPGPLLEELCAVLQQVSRFESGDPVQELASFVGPVTANYDECLAAVEMHTALLRTDAVKLGWALLGYAKAMTR